MSEPGPRLLGRYEIQEEIGRGMMGVVYRALDPALGRTVALKTVSLHLAVPDADRPGFEQRFLNEARIAASLSHPGIVVVHDVGRDPASASLYIALEYLEGETLAARAQREGAFDWREAFRLTAGVASALHHAHQRQIVHRDVKPANIMVLPSGEPKLMDFGIAKVPAAQLTSAGEFFGTPSYMSPEQANGDPLDARSDVFSLGAVLYLLLTGVRAFDAPSVPGILARVASKDPTPPSRMVPEIPSVVDDVVARALAKDVGARYATAQMLAEDIQDVLDDRPPRHRATWTPPLPADRTIASASPPPEADTADLRLSASVAPGLPAAPRRAAGPLRRLAERVGLRGALVLGALLAVGLAFPIAARRGGEALPPPISLPGLPAASEPGHLAIAFDHSLRTGTLRVYVDDEAVVEEEFSGKVTKKVLSFRMHKGSSRQVLDIAPGEHLIRVQVNGSGFDGSRRIRGTFKSGETRHLEATIDGLIRKDLNLVWGSSS
ncbi:MAG TPA: protein kinase [Vicinamibacteria bacterium]|nr:protein kinase [Vicinamibacteria bacterium]